MANTITQQQSIPGLNLPTQTAMLAGNPRDSAIASQAASTNKLTALNAAVSGGRGSRRRRGRRHHYTRGRARHHARCLCHCSCAACRKCAHKGGTGRGRRRGRHTRRGGATAAATVAVPQFTMQYTPTGAAGQTPNDIIKANSQIGTQSAANAAFDGYAKQKGGYIWRRR